MKNVRGVTLIEIVVAIVVLSVGALALAGSAAVMLRRMSDSSRGAAAASVARALNEAAFSRSCATLSSGNKQTAGIQSEWSVGASAASTNIRQRVTYATRGGSHTDDFLTAVPCD
jgi:prepilin-type N-terminal cleavage/methylation domain-containing protein